ncbi:hypothetical protein ETU09_00040 [Apibacter muscae]|uniref:Tyr recombinase domain-containing protein n=2 Tax=Apibacter muscae TaxID=2509004 RepID=A0A563DN24_9FLAO|nr:hypothetical protein ETU09_00040 [Apibacter muscae]
MTLDPRKYNLKRVTMIEERLQNYKKYLELKGYQASSIRGLLKRASLYEKDNSLSRVLLKPSTLQLYYYQKKTYLNYLSEVEQQTHYLAEEHYKKEQSPIETLSLQEVQELERNCKNLRDKIVLIGLYSLGLRLSEIANVELEDIDLNQQIVLIKKSKTRKQRLVPINLKTNYLLKKYIEQERPIAKGNKLLQGLKGDLTPDGIYQILKKIQKRTPIKKRIYPHLLRHSIASHLLSQGMELEHISQFLGHSSISSTELYTHIESIEK